MKRQKTFFLVAAASGKPLLPQELKNLTKRGQKDKGPEAGIEKDKEVWSK